jgi:SAM-dependent methyltransferase
MNGPADPAGRPPTGGGIVAPDGSPVEVYRRLPPNGEAELISGELSPGASILELGAGVGRVTRRLIELRHPVTAVEIEPAMLAELPSAAEAIGADAATLDLGRTFGGVVMGSHLVHAPDGLGPAFLATARRHLGPDGRLVAQAYPEDFDWQAAIGRTAMLGEVEIGIVAARPTPAGIAATVAYAVDGRTWHQSFEAERLGTAAVVAALEAAGFRFDRWLAPALGWFVAAPAPGA